MRHGRRLAVVIPARDEESRIAATVTAASSLPAVDVVVVVSDASHDATIRRARECGAVVIPSARHHGKAAAMVAGADAVRVLDETDDALYPRALLFLDADLGESAAEAAPLISPVLAGTVDMTIATLPPAAVSGGGRGRVVRLAARGIERSTGWRPEQPLSGQRCLTRSAFDYALPLAPGFGVETAMTIDLLRGGYRVAEVPTAISHRVTGHDVRSKLHRARQLAHVARAVYARELPAPVLDTSRRLRHIPVHGVFAGQ